MTGADREPPAVRDPGAREQPDGELSRVLDSARRALSGIPAWIVGGAVRDRLMGRPTDDWDLAVDGDIRGAARAVARATGGAPFSLSDTFGGWRVVGPGGAWQLDLMPLQGGGLAEDLALRDFTVNAMAEPLDGGPLVDLHGGERDLAARRLRPVGPTAFAADPLRTLRGVRQAVELGLMLEDDTVTEIRAHGPGLVDVAAERIFAELVRLLRAPDPVSALGLLDRCGLTRHVMPELDRLRGVEQGPYHHLDVHGHTLEVLDGVALLQRDPAAAGLKRHSEAVGALLAEPLADGLSRGDAMRWAAILHDAAKPDTRAVAPDGRIGFPDHDRQGEALARRTMRRLRVSERLTTHVASLVRHHLHLGFLVHEAPLDARTTFRYLHRCGPGVADITVLTVADRRATRGRGADVAIPAHIDLAESILDAALSWQQEGPVRAAVDGGELMVELGLPPGPLIGDLLHRLAEDRFAGRAPDRATAIARAREHLRDQAT